MLAVHLTALDLSRTAVRAEPSVMTELTAAGKRLMSDETPPGLVSWQARTRLALRPEMRPFLDLCRVPRWTPDFLTPISHGADLQTELAAVLSASMTELGQALADGELPERVRPLAEGQPGAIAALGNAIRAFHAVAVAPYWTEITDAVLADRTSRGATVVEHGIERVLTTLSPELRWRASTLSYECAGGDDFHIWPDGRGLVLVPTYLKHQPGFLDLGHGPVVIEYPIERRQATLTTRRSLADLVGRTRAAVLGAIDGERNTTDIARHIGTSLASVSQHTAVLRATGLIATSRTGPAVRHSLTPLGRSLLQASSDRGFSVR